MNDTGHLYNCNALRVRCYSARCDCDSLSHHGAIPGSIEATIAGSAGELLIFPVLTLAF